MKTIFILCLISFQMFTPTNHVGKMVNPSADFYQYTNPIVYINNIVNKKTEETR